MFVYHLLEVVNTEVKNNFLKFTVKVESNHLRILLDKQWRCYLDQLGSIGGSDLSPHQTLLKISFPVLYLYAVQSIECFPLSEKTDTTCHMTDSTRTHRYMQHMYTSATQSSYNRHAHIGTDTEKITNKIHKAASKHTQIQTHETTRQRTEDTGALA